MAITQKMRAAREALERRLQRAALRLRGRGAKEQPTLSRSSDRAGEGCTVKLDRLRLLSRQNPTHVLMRVPGFRSLKAHRVRRMDPKQFQPYSRAHWFKRENSEMKFCVESDRREAWLPPFRVTLFADDRTGLLPEEIFPILEVLPTVKVTMVELAFDFSPATDVTRRYVRRYALFGKSRRDPSEKNQAVDRWGAKKGGKRTKSYYKQGVGAHRVELEMRSKFLRRHHINDVFDFVKLVELLPRRQVFFGRLHPQRLAARLLESGFSVRKMLRIMGVVGETEQDLCATLSYLRRKVELKNVRRLLVPLHTNRLVREALEAWAAKWPKKPRRL